MPIEDFFRMLDSQSVISDYIVRVKYKHLYEDYYTYSNEFLAYDPQIIDYVWLNDWNEGEDDCYVVAWVRLEDVFSKGGYHYAD